VSFGEPIALRQMELEQVAPAAPGESCELRARVETEFIEKLRRGDAAAFEQLVTERSGEIYGLLFRLTENSEEARDLTQETFLRAFQSIGRFRGGSIASPSTRPEIAGAGGAGAVATRQCHSTQHRARQIRH